MQTGRWTTTSLEETQVPCSCEPVERNWMRLFVAHYFTCNLSTPIQPSSARGSKRWLKAKTKTVKEAVAISSTYSPRVYKMYQITTIITKSTAPLSRSSAFRRSTSHKAGRHWCPRNFNRAELEYLIRTTIREHCKDEDGVNANTTAFSTKQTESIKTANPKWRRKKIRPA